MRIRTKFLLVLSVLTVLIILIFGTAQFQTNIIDRRTESLRENYDALLMTEQILINIKNKAISMRNIILAEDSQSVLNEIAAIEEGDTKISHSIYTLEPFLNLQNPEYMENLESAIVKYNAYSDQVLALINEGNKQEALRLINSEGSKSQDEVFRVVSEIVGSFETDMKTALSDSIDTIKRIMLYGRIISIAGIIIISGIIFLIVLDVTTRLKKVSEVMLSVANGSAALDTRLEVKSKDEIGDVSNSFNKMANFLEEQVRWEKEQLWLKSNVAEITKKLNGMKGLKPLSHAFLSHIAPLLEVCHAVFYIKDENDQKDKPVFKLLASYAFKERKHLYTRFDLGEGIIGQAALENTPILLTNVPPDYIRACSGLGEAPPNNIYVLPVTFNDNVSGVIELASFKTFTPIQQELLEEVVDYLGVILENIKGSIQLTLMYNESQAQLEEIQSQSEKLQLQQEELRSAYEMLEKQTEELRQSKEELQTQQEELEQTNEELREKTEALELKNKKLEAANIEVAAARAELEEQAKHLALSSKYKSEFLANMSHELRTPLNSLIILSKLLADNPDGNLTDKQVEFSNTIHSSASDLLSIINDILDLSKIESGKMEVVPDKVFIKDVVEFINKSFEPIALDKKLKFHTVIKDNCPDSIYSDENRITKILVNLLSNAFKFTSEGEVTLEISPSGIADDKICFAVSDTGIGIPKDKLELIFEAFQQADGTKSRKYGGTGLGLSISRELAELLGGEIHVESEEGKGSTFTFCVGDYRAPDKSGLNSDSVIPDESGIKSILIVDDDLLQRNSLMEIIGSKDVVIKAVSTGAEAIEQLKVGHFDCMILDLELSDISGFEFLERINNSEINNNMMIYIYTNRKLTSKEELYLKKYAHSIIIKDSLAPQRLVDELELFLHSDEKKTEASGGNETDDADYCINTDGLAGKEVLIVDDDARNVYAISSVLESYGLIVTFAENGLEALDILKEKAGFDLIIMDIMMPEMDGLEAMPQIRSMPQYKNTPIIALTAKAMKADREECMKAGASDYIAKPVNPDQLMSLIKVWLYREGNK